MNRKCWCDIQWERINLVRPDLQLQTPFLSIEADNGFSGNERRVSCKFLADTVTACFAAGPVQHSRRGYLDLQVGTQQIKGIALRGLGQEVASLREAIMHAEYCAGKFVQTSRQSLRPSAPNPTPRSVAAGRAIDA